MLYDDETLLKDVTTFENTFQKFDGRQYCKTTAAILPAHFGRTDLPEPLQ